MSVDHVATKLVALVDPVVVGRVTAVHGIKGWVKVQSFTEPEENIFDYFPWWFETEKGWREIKIEEYRVTNKGLLVHLVDVNDRDIARQFCQRNIVVEKSKFPVLRPDEYYWYQLQGLQVVTCQGNVKLGIVTGLLETGANDVLEIKGDSSSLDYTERLIPYTEQFVLGIDLEAKKIEVDWDPEF